MKYERKLCLYHPDRPESMNGLCNECSTMRGWLVVHSMAFGRVERIKLMLRHLEDMLRQEEEKP